MKYTLEYFDRTLQRPIVTSLIAETIEAAQKASMRILQDKDFDDPGLYSAETDFCKED